MQILKKGFSIFCSSMFAAGSDARDSQSGQTRQQMKMVYSR